MNNKFYVLLVLLVAQALCARVFFFNSTSCDGMFYAAELHPNNDCLQRADGSFIKYNCQAGQVQVCDSNAPCSTCTNVQTFATNQCYNGRRFSCEDILPNNYGSSVFNITRGPCGAPSSFHIQVRTPVCRPTEDGTQFQIVNCIGNKKVVRTCSDRDCKHNCVEASRNLNPCVNLNGFNATETCMMAPPPAQLKACYLSDIDAALRTMAQLLNSTLSDANGDVIRQTFERLLGDKLAPCIELMNRFVTGYTESNTQVVTAECNVDRQDPSWATDPCCNAELQKTMCCAPRTITKTVRFPVLAPVNCTNTERIRAIYYSYFNLLYNQKPAPESEEAKVSRAIPDCAAHVMRANLPCQSNSDCIFTQNCRPNGFCKAVNTPTEFYNAFAKCILEDASAPAGGAVPPLGRALVAQRLQAAPTVAAIAQAMSNTFSNGGSCIRTNINGNVDPTMLTTQSACESQSVRCNNPAFQSADNCNTAPSNQFFCGDCTNENTCMSHPTTNATICTNNIVTCSKGVDASTGMADRANCDSSRYTCTIRPDLYKNQADCQNLARDCSVAPGKAAVCLLRNEKSFTNCQALNTANLRCLFNFGYCTCTHQIGNLTQSGLQSFCSNQQGQFVMLDSQAACENIEKRCMVNRHSGLISLAYDNTECTKCGGNIVPAYTWRVGQWLNDNIVRPATWMPVAPIRAYQWITPGFDAVRFKDWIGQTVGAVYSRYLAAQAKRVYFAQLEFIRKFACDCGAQKRMDCFAEPVKFGVAVVNAVPGNAQVFNFPEANVTVKANSFNNNRGASVSVEVEQAQIDVDAAPSTTRKWKQTTNTNIAIVDRGTGKTIGHVIGNGISLSTAPDNAITLCLPIDSRVVTTYTKAAFAILENGVYRVTSIAPVTESGGSLCADITSTATYYPAKIDATVNPQGSSVTPSSTPKKPNSAAISSVSSLLIMFILFMALF